MCDDIFFLGCDHIGFSPIFPHIHISQVFECKSLGSYINISWCFEAPHQGIKFPVQILKMHKKERNSRNKVVSFIHMEISWQGVEGKTKRDLETGMSCLEKAHTEWQMDREGLSKEETQNSCFGKDTGYRKTKRKKKYHFFFFFNFNNS